MLARVQTTSVIGSNVSFVSRLRWSACIHRIDGRASALIRSPSGSTVSHACSVHTQQVLVTDISPSQCAVLLVDPRDIVVLAVSHEPSPTSSASALTVTVLTPGQGTHSAVSQLMQGQGSAHIAAVLEGSLQGLHMQPHFVIVSQKQQSGVDERSVTVVRLPGGGTQTPSPSSTHHYHAHTARIPAHAIAGKGKTRAVAGLRLNDARLLLALAVGSTVLSLSLTYASAQHSGAAAAAADGVLRLDEDKASTATSMQALKAQAGGDVRSLCYILDAASHPVLCWTSDAPLSVLTQASPAGLDLQPVATTTLTSMRSSTSAAAQTQERSLPTPVFVADGLNEIVSIVKSSSASSKGRGVQQRTQGSTSPLSALAAAVENSLDVSRDIGAGVGRSFSHTEQPSMLGEEEEGAARQEEVDSLDGELRGTRAATESGSGVLIDPRGLGRLPPSPSTDDDHHTLYTQHTADSLGHSRASPTTTALEVVTEHMSTFGSSLSEIMATWGTEKAAGAGRNSRRAQDMLLQGGGKAGSVLGQLLNIRGQESRHGVAGGKAASMIIQDLSKPQLSTATSAPLATLSLQWMHGSGDRVDVPLHCLHDSTTSCRSAHILDALPLAEGGRVLVAVTHSLSSAVKGTAGAVAQLVIGYKQEVARTPVVTAATAQSLTGGAGQREIDVVMAGRYTSSTSTGVDLTCLGAIAAAEQEDAGVEGVETKASGFMFMGGTGSRTWQVVDTQPVSLPEGVTISKTGHSVAPGSGAAVPPREIAPSSVVAPATPQRVRGDRQVAVPLRPLDSSDRKQKKEPGSQPAPQQAATLPVPPSGPPFTPGVTQADATRKEGSQGTPSSALLGGRTVQQPRTQQQLQQFASPAWRISSVQPVAVQGRVSGSGAGLLPLPAPIPNPPSPELPVLNTAVQPSASSVLPSSPVRNLDAQSFAMPTSATTRMAYTAGGVSGWSRALQQHHPRELALSGQSHHRGVVNAEEGIVTPHLRPRSPTERRLPVVGQAPSSTAPKAASTADVQGASTSGKQVVHAPVQSPAHIGRSTPPEKKRSSGHGGTSTDGDVVVRPQAGWRDGSASGSVSRAGGVSTTEVTREGWMTPPQLTGVGGTESSAPVTSRMQASSSAVEPVSPVAHSYAAAGAAHQGVPDSHQRAHDRVRIGQALFRDTHSTYDSPLPPATHAQVLAQAASPSTLLLASARSNAGTLFVGLQAEAAAAQAVAQAQASKALTLAFKALTGSASEAEIAAAHKGIELARFALEIAANNDM